MSNWDDDFWSDDEATSVADLSNRNQPARPVADSIDLPPDLPPIHIPYSPAHIKSQRSFPSEPIEQLQSPVFSEPRRPMSPGLSFNQAESPAVSPLFQTQSSLRSSSETSSGWGWSSIAAKVASSAAELILMPEDNHRPSTQFEPQAEKFSPLESVSLQSKPVLKANPQSKPPELKANSWFKSVATVLKDVKVTAGQSGRELFQVATEVLENVKNPNPPVSAASSFDFPGMRQISTVPNQQTRTAAESPSLTQPSSQSWERSSSSFSNDGSIHSELPSSKPLLLSVSPVPPKLPDAACRSVLPLVSERSYSPTSLNRSRSPSPARHAGNQFTASSQFSPRSFLSSKLPNANQQSPRNLLGSELQSNVDQWSEDEFKFSEQSSSSNDDRDLIPSDSSPTGAQTDEPSQSGWLQGMFEGVKASAAQSGQEIFQVSGTLTSEVLDKARKVIPSISSQPSLFVALDRTSAPPVPRSPPKPITLNEVFPDSRLVRSSDRELPEDDTYQYSSHEMDVKIGDVPSIESSDTHSQTSDVREEFDPVVSNSFSSFLELPDAYDDCAQESFDQVFTRFGGSEPMVELESYGRDRFILLQRHLSRCSPSVRSRFDDIKGILCQADVKYSANSLLIATVRQLISQLHNWHDQVLKIHICQGDNVDVSNLCDNVHVLCTRTLGILAARSITVIADAAKSWNDETTDVNLLATNIYGFKAKIIDETDQIISSGTDAVRQVYSSSNEYDDDIALLHVDIELEAKEVRHKIEDAVDALVSILQCLILPR